MGQRENIPGEQAERLDRAVAGLQAEAQNHRGRGRHAQDQVGGIFAPVGQRNGQAFILIAQAIFGIEELAVLQVAPDGGENLPVAPEIDVGLGVDFLAAGQAQGRSTWGGSWT